MGKIFLSKYLILFLQGIYSNIDAKTFAILLACKRQDRSQC
jgi:hypothetical protein